MMHTEPNKVIMINAQDLITDPEPHTNEVNGKTVMAQCMTGSFIITNSEGEERSGDKGDWLICDADGTLRTCWPEVFAGNYTKKKE